MKKGLTLFLIMILSLTWAPAFANAASPWMQATKYEEKAQQKLGFGLKNTLLGWTELIQAPKRASANNENVFKGIGEGIWNTVVYTGGGLIHLVTFPFMIDVPIPNNGVSLE